MEINENTYERIDLYLSGQLAQEEVKTFEQEIEKDPELAREVRLHKEILNTMSNATEEDQFKSIIGEIGEEYRPERHKSTPKTARIRMIRTISLAASVLLLVVCIGYLMTRSASLTNEQLFAETFSPPVLTEVSRGADDPAMANVKAAYEAYENADYAQAVTAFEKLVKSSPETNYQYYLGVSCLGLKPSDSQCAVANLDNVIQQGNNPYVQGAKWYRSLAAIQLGDLAGARETLNELASLSGKYQQPASDLMKKLDKIKQ